ncbi:MAG: superoxide dismutase [bacterium]
MYTQPDLPYDFSALEPYIDAKTMEIHYSKHHATYTAKFNEALTGIETIAGNSVVEILKNLDKIPEAKRQAVINHGGGYLNHSFYWSIMTPGGKQLSDIDLKTAIINDFGSLEKFQELFTSEAMAVFGSGWAWLVKDNISSKLSIQKSLFQDNPISKSDVTPILTVDVWEHAYYLKHQNRRDNYLADWWHIINWEEVAKKFQS